MRRKARPCDNLSSFLLLFFKEICQSLSYCHIEISGLFYSVNSSSCQLYEFPITNYHKLSDLKTNDCLIALQVKNLTGLKSRTLQDYVASGGSKGETTSLSFPASQAVHIPRLVYPSSHWSYPCFGCHTSSDFNRLPLSYNDLCDYIGPGSPSHVKILNYICKVPFSM